MAVSAAQAQSGEGGVIRIGDVAAQVGEEVTVTLEAVDVPPPGLAVWVLDTMYDPAVATAESCVSFHGGVCSTAFMAGTARVTGASAEGITGTFPLADITFLCGPEEGRTALALSQEILTTAGVTLPMGAGLENGSITCTEPSPTAEPSATPQIVLPNTGSGTTSGSERRPLVVGLLAACGLAAAGAAAFVLGRA